VVGEHRERRDTAKSVDVGHPIGHPGSGAFVGRHTLLFVRESGRP
jgi:hypothetical protein